MAKNPYNLSTMWRFVTQLIVVWCLTLVACRSDVEQTRAPDFVGSAPQHVSPVATERAGGTPEPEFNIDLIEDILFRSQRDGWTLVDPAAHTSLDKLRKGGLGLVFAALPSAEGPGVEQVVKQIEAMEKLVAQTGGAARITAELDQAQAIARSAGVAFMLLLEGAQALQGSLERLPELKARGLAMVGIVSSRGNAFADSAAALRNPSGLTKAGRELLRALVEAGIAVDLTHASPAAFWEALCTAGVPVFVTHTASAGIRPASRNLDDLQVLALARTGGLVGLVLNPELIKGEAQGAGAGVSDVVAHLQRWKELGATTGIALGTDYGGIVPPSGLEDASKLPTLSSALRAKGWSEGDLRGVLGGNAWRALKMVSSPGGLATTGEALHPIALECDCAEGEIEGPLSATCDGLVLGTSATIPQEARLRLRLSDMRSEPVRLELFGEPGTLWQIEAQNVDGRPLTTRLLQLDETGKGSVPLPSGRGMARVFVSPTRVSELREAVVWGHWPGALDLKEN
ncbi:MAG: dipeptidase [Myxococcota bacterium]|jgi:membrane dipeptidase|nr:dipeptidase [Myxococcota bacterium]